MFRSRFNSVTSQYIGLKTDLALSQLTEISTADWECNESNEESGDVVAITRSCGEILSGVYDSTKFLTVMS